MLRDKMLAVMDEVNSEAAERQELIRMIAMALLSGSNLFILGAPGQAKSFVVNEVRKRITGATQFERLLSKQTDEEALFGRLDLASLIPGAVPAQVLGEDGTYQSLRAQLAQAAEDYRQLLKRVKKNPANREALDETLQVERFFRSGWYQRLTNVDGEFLIRKLQENI